VGLACAPSSADEEPTTCAPSRAPKPVEGSPAPHAAPAGPARAHGSPGAECSRMAEPRPWLSWSGVPQGAWTALTALPERDAGERLDRPGGSLTARRACQFDSTVDPPQRERVDRYRQARLSSSRSVAPRSTQAARNKRLTARGCAWPSTWHPRCFCSLDASTRRTSMRPTDHDQAGEHSGHGPLNPERLVSSAPRGLARPCRTLAPTLHRSCVGDLSTPCLSVPTLPDP